MQEQDIHKQLHQLKFDGDIYTDNLHKIIYATDASAYREVPIAVVRPKHKADIKSIINFANQNQVTLIPRAAGTSLAGQVVGYGIVVDISKYFTRIKEINTEKGYAIFRLNEHTARLKESAKMTLIDNASVAA